MHEDTGSFIANVQVPTSLHKPFVKELCISETLHLQNDSFDKISLSAAVISVSWGDSYFSAVEKSL